MPPSRPSPICGNQIKFFFFLFWLCVSRSSDDKLTVYSNAKINFLWLNNVNGNILFTQNIQTDDNVNRVTRVPCAGISLYTFVKLRRWLVLRIFVCSFVRVTISATVRAYAVVAVFVCVWRRWIILISLIVAWNIYGKQTEMEKQIVHHDDRYFCNFFLFVTWCGEVGGLGMRVGICTQRWRWQLSSLSSSRLSNRKKTAQKWQFYLFILCACIGWLTAIYIFTRMRSHNAIHTHIYTGYFRIASTETHHHREWWK